MNDIEDVITEMFYDVDMNKVDKNWYESPTCALLQIGRNWLWRKYPSEQNGWEWGQVKKGEGGFNLTGIELSEEDTSSR